MGDQESAAGPYVMDQGPADMEFGDAVQAGGGVVKDQQPARMGERPCQAEALDLPAGQRGVGQRREVSVREEPDEGVRTGRAGGGLDRLGRGLVRAEADGGPYRPAEQGGAFEGVADLAAQLCRVGLVEGIPSSSTCPLSGSVSRPATAASSDLPAPEWPTTAMVVPPGTTRSTSRSTGAPPRRTVTARSSSRPGPSAGSGRAPCGAVGRVRSSPVRWARRGCARGS